MEGVGGIVSSPSGRSFGRVGLYVDSGAGGGVRGSRVLGTLGVGSDVTCFHVNGVGGTLLEPSAGVGLSVTSFHVKTGLSVGDEVITIGVGRNVVGSAVVGSAVVGSAVVGVSVVGSAVVGSAVVGVSVVGSAVVGGEVVGTSVVGLGVGCTHEVKMKGRYREKMYEVTKKHTHRYRSYNSLNKNR